MAGDSTEDVHSAIDDALAAQIATRAVNRPKAGGKLDRSLGIFQRPRSVCGDKLREMARQMVAATLARGVHRRPASALEGLHQLIYVLH
jgi:hypothetical protein